MQLSRKEGRIIDPVIIWIITAFVARALTKLILPSDNPGGILVTILVGIPAAFVGGFFMSLIGVGQGGLIWTTRMTTIGASYYLPSTGCSWAGELPSYGFLYKGSGVNAPILS